MLNSRNFYIGVGIGLIISSLILMPLNLSLANEIENLDNNITIDELKLIAAEKNLHILTDEEYEKLKNPESPKEETANEEDKNTDESKEAKDENKVAPDTFTISQGMQTEEIADYLLDSGIIDDKEYFLKILNDKGLTKKIIAGTYEYEQDLTAEDIIELITK